MTAPFLVIQYPYDYIEIALCESLTIIKKVEIHKFEAIKLLIPTIHDLLAGNNLELKDLAAIGVNRGPGPYNTLRSIISTLHGFQFTHTIHFVELEALPLLLDNQPNNSIALLNAFAQRVYYGIKINHEIIQNVCAITDLPKILSQHNLLNTPMQCVGNGAVVYQEQLAQLTPHLKIFEPKIMFNDLAVLVSKTSQAIQNKQFSTSYCEPLYLN